MLTRAIRLAGELGRVDLRDRLRPWLTARDDGCRFWAAWSAGLLGDRTSAIPFLREFAVGDGPFKWRALDLAIRLMDREVAISLAPGTGTGTDECPPSSGRSRHPRRPYHHALVDREDEPNQGWPALPAKASR